MVITDTPRSLAISFIRVLMIAMQYIEPSGSVLFFTMTLAKRAKGIPPKLWASCFSENSFSRALSPC